MRTAAFLASSLLVIMSPGPDLALVTRLVVRHRRPRPALAAALGMITAGALHVALGLLGLAALLAVDPGLFRTLRLAGAAVLLAFGLRALRAAVRPRARGAERDLPDRRAFLQGLLCTAANPKVGVFLMAFLPQFVPEGAAPTLGVAALAAVYLALGLAWLVVWIHLVHRGRRRAPAERLGRAVDAAAGVVFAVFACALLLGL